MWRYSKDTDEEEEVSGESKDSLQERTLRAAKAARRAVAEKAERLCYQAVRLLTLTLPRIPTLKHQHQHKRYERANTKRERFWTNETSTTEIQH